jgi:pyruvate formate lyase activating enzyme
MTIDAQGRRQIDLGRCDLCGLCIEQCHANALEGVGAVKTVSDVMHIVEQDQPFYEESGGGMTLSGGEPLAQPDFTFQLLKTAHRRGIHTAMETSGFASWDVWSRLLPYLDLILYDIKEVDPERHQYSVGTLNKLILDNLRKLAQTGKPIIIRRPVVRGYNDSLESIHALGQFIRALETVHEINLLPYHRLGKSKYERLGRPYALDDLPTMKDEEVTGIRDILLTYGLKVKIGG